MRRVRSVAVVAGLVMVAGGLAACGSSSKAPAANTPISGQTITLYNGQHEQTTNALVAAFTKQTGVKVKVRSDDEDVLAQQIQQEGSHSPADVFYTENSPPLARLDEAGLLSPVDALDAGRGAGRRQRAATQLGRRLGAGQPAGLQHRQAQAVRPPDARCSAWPTRSGRARSASRRARPTSRRS